MNSNFSNVFIHSRIILKDVEKQEKTDHKSPLSGYIGDAVCAQFAHFGYKMVT